MRDLERLTEIVRQFRDRRGWGRHHTPKNLAQAIGVEAGELNDLYLWDREPSLEDVADEMADVLIYLLHLADVTGIDLGAAVKNKVVKNHHKYPVETAKEVY